MGVSNLVGNSVLNHVVKGVWPTWISLHTAEPVVGGASNEVTGTNYSRELVNPTDWTTPANKSTGTGVTLTFDTAGSNWGTITHVGVYDAATGGNLLWWGALNVQRTVNTGETLAFSAGNLTTQVV